MPHGSLNGDAVLLVAHELPEALTQAELPAALDWVARQPASIGISIQAARIIETILVAAWIHTDWPEVPQALGRAIWARLGHHHQLPPPVGRSTTQSTPEDLARRRRLLRMVVPPGAAPSESGFRLCFSARPLLASPDLGWLIEELKAEPDSAWRLMLAECIWYVADKNDLDQVDALVTTAARSGELRERIRPLTDPIALGSEQANQQREMHQRMQQLEKQRAHDPTAGVDWQHEVRAGLDRCQDEPGFFWTLNLILARSEETGDIGGDLRQLPGWMEADPPTQRELITAALRYVAEADAPDWGDHPEQSRRGRSAVRALRLLLDEAPDELGQVPSEAWARWATPLMAYADSGGNNPTWLADLVTRAYVTSPDAIVDAAVAQISREDAGQHHHLFVLGRLGACGHGSMVDALGGKAGDAALHPEALAQVLEQLFGWAPDVGRKAAVAILGGLGTTQAATERALAAARVLLLLDTENSWPEVWELLTKHPDRADEVIKGAATAIRLDAGRVTMRLPTADLAALCEWLTGRFQLAGDPAVPAARYLSAFDSVEDMKRIALNELAVRGTADACAALQRMRDRHPEDLRLPGLATFARTVLRARSWVAPSPAELLRMVASGESRWVESADHLLDLVREALDGYQMKLLREPWVVESLWDRQEVDKWTPKPEAQFRDAVSSHIRDDLLSRQVVVNREVEVGRLAGAHAGRRSDILVTAVRHDAAGRREDTVSVVIEVKGCWHEDWPTAIKDQLVDDYLANSGLTHGIYLLGWFDCTLWRTGSGRSRCRGERDSVTTHLDGLASELSTVGVRVSAYVIDAALRDR